MDPLWALNSAEMLISPNGLLDTKQGTFVG
jgi:hypothetical protein